MSNRSRRAALQAQQEAAAKAKKNRRILIAAGACLALVVVVVLAIVLLQQRSAAPANTAEQQTPPNATSGYGISLGGKPAVDGTPHLVIWGDYMCPGCAGYEGLYGKYVEELVQQGRITAEIRTAYFKDNGVSYGPSKRAAIGAAAADAVGKFDEFHAGLFANQSTGYPEEFVRDELPKQIGLAGAELTKFQELFDQRAFDQWTADAYARMQPDGIESTPTYLVGDTKLEFFDDNNQQLIGQSADALFDAISQAAN